MHKMKMKVTIAEPQITEAFGTDGYTYTAVQKAKGGQQSVVTITSRQQMPNPKKFMDRLIKIANTKPGARTIHIATSLPKGRVIVVDEKPTKKR
jgi:hypothetical protein